jgi:hypothetical protein
LVGWDGAEKAIRGIAVFSERTGFAEGTYYRKNGKWGGKFVITTPEGEEIKIQSELTVSDNGNTHTWVTIDEDGNEVPRSAKTWKRVEK